MLGQKLMIQDFNNNNTVSQDHRKKKIAFLLFTRKRLNAIAIDIYIYIYRGKHNIKLGAWIFSMPNLEQRCRKVP